MNELLIFFFVLVFGLGIVYLDLKYRKVSNWITYTFLLGALGIFVYDMNNYNLFNVIILFCILILTFLTYSFRVCGAADGKIFIALSLVFLATNNESGVLNFFLNTVVLYSLTLFIFSLLITSIKSKNKVLRKIRYYEHFFFVLFIFIMGTLIYKFLLSKISYYYSLSIGIILLIVFFTLTNKIKKILRKQEKKIIYFINSILFFVLLIIANSNIINYFIIVFFIKTLIDFISKLTLEINDNKKIYESPFSLYLIVGALLTLIIKINLLEFFV